MSEFEKINASVKAQMAARRAAAIKRVLAVMVALLVAVAIITGLEAIGFISWVFSVILTAIAVCITTFKAGYIWHDIKF